MDIGEVIEKGTRRVNVPEWQKGTPERREPVVPQPKREKTKEPA